MLLTMTKISGMLAQVCTVMSCTHMLGGAQLSVLELSNDYRLGWPLSSFNINNDTACLSTCMTTD